MILDLIQITKSVCYITNIMRFDLGSWPQQLLILVALALAVVVLVITLHPLFACGWHAVVVGTYSVVTEATTTVIVNAACCVIACIGAPIAVAVYGSSATTTVLAFV